MFVYAVKYINDSWANPGEKIVGIFDTEEKAKECFDHVKDILNLGDDAEDCMYIKEYALNIQAYPDNYIKEVFK